MEKAKVALRHAQQYQSKWHNFRHYTVNFNMGDSILLSMHHIDLKGNHKLKPCFIGPFLMVQKVGSQAYQLRLPVALKHVHDVFHVSLLKPFYSGGDGQDTPAPMLVDSKVEYEVDLIVGHWSSRGVHWYLVYFARYYLFEALWMIAFELPHDLKHMQKYNLAHWLG